MPIVQIIFLKILFIENIHMRCKKIARINKEKVAEKSAPEILKCYFIKNSTNWNLLLRQTESFTYYTNWNFLITSFLIFHH